MSLTNQKAEEHYDELKAEGKSDEEILKILTELFYNTN